MPNKYDYIKGYLRGIDCFLIGSGPSLKDFDFSLLDDKYTIGINHIVEHYENLDCLLFGDRIFAKTTTYDLTKFKGKIFSSVKASQQESVLKVAEQDNFYEFEDNRFGISRDIQGEGLYHPTNSGIMAMNLALIMRPRKIYLLGFDYKYANNQMHFYEDRPHHSRYPEEKFIKKLDKMQVFSGYKDMFVNLSLDSNITFFEKRHWRGIL